MMAEKNHEYRINSNARIVGIAALFCGSSVLSDRHLVYPRSGDDRARDYRGKGEILDVEGRARCWI